MKMEDIALKTAKAALAFGLGERDLLEADANERSITHKLAEYLQGVFPEWNVDCEYNRLGDKIKRLPAAQPSSTDDTQGRSIFPDIIVHRRRTNENLLVVEVKKTTNKLLGDEEKLCALTADDGEFAYTLGLHVIFDCRKFCIETAIAYSHGTTNQEITSVLQRALSL